MSLPRFDRIEINPLVEIVADGRMMRMRVWKHYTVDMLKLILSRGTNIPLENLFLLYKGNVLEDRRTFGSYGVESDDIIHLVRRGLPLITPVFSHAKFSSPTYTRETNGVNANIVHQNEPGNPLNQTLDVATIINSIPILSQAAQDPEVDKMLQNTIILRCVLSYLFYLEIYRGKASDVADVMNDIESQIERYKLKCLYDAQQEMEQAHGSDELVEPSPVHNSHKGAFGNFLEILLSDATLLRYYKEQAKSIDGAITAMLGWHDACQDQSSAGLAPLGVPLNAHPRPFEKLLLALPDDENYNSSSSSNDGSDDITEEEKQSEELLSSQLARMKELGFMNCEENIRALLKSGADVEKAIETLLEQHV